MGAKLQQTSQRMAQGKQQPKFERNPCIRFKDNCVTEGRTATDDGQIAIP